MTREDLFAAIGMVEISRLAKSELELVPGSEEMSNRKQPGRFTRHLLIAAIIVSLLMVTGCAVAGYVIYDNPEDMISSIFGNKTGFDSGEYTEIPDPERPGGLLAVQPEYNRVEADPKVVQEDVAPYVSPVGKSITFKNMTLTVDSFLYDSGTKCGIVTYTLTNPPEYETQYDGRIYCEGWRGISFTQYGYDYIIQEKTTEDTLTAARYFRNAVDKGDFSVGLYEEVPTDGLDETCMEEVRAQYTPEEAIERAWEYTKEWGTEERFRQDIGWFGEEGAAYRLLRDVLYNERSSERKERSGGSERITFDCSRSSGIRNITLGDSDVILSPISMQMDLRGMKFLSDEDKLRHMDVSVRFADGTEYVVNGENANGDWVINCLFNVIGPEEPGPGHGNVLHTFMFNRVIDLDQVTSVKINGTELTRD